MRKPELANKAEKSSDVLKSTNPSHPGTICMKYTLLLKRFDFKSFFFLNEINTFIQKGCIKLIKSDRKNIYNFSNIFYFK